MSDFAVLQNEGVETTNELRRLARKLLKQVRAIDEGLRCGVRKFNEYPLSDIRAGELTFYSDEGPTKFWYELEFLYDAANKVKSGENYPIGQMRYQFDKIERLLSEFSSPDSGATS